MELRQADGAESSRPCSNDAPLLPFLRRSISAPNLGIGALAGGGLEVYVSGFPSISRRCFCCGICLPETGRAWPQRAWPNCLFQTPQLCFDAKLLYYPKRTIAVLYGCLIPAVWLRSCWNLNAAALYFTELAEGATVPRAGLAWMCDWRFISQKLDAAATSLNALVQNIPCFRGCPIWKDGHLHRSGNLRRGKVGLLTCLFQRARWFSGPLQNLEPLCQSGYLLA